MADSFDFTPESAAGPWSGPDVGVRRARVPTKEDLITALGQMQAGPPSPYQLQMEAPMVAGAEPNREQQFKQDWDVAMQQYEQALHRPRTLPLGITYQGADNQPTNTLATPESLQESIIGPLRLRAGEFSPGITGAFNSQTLENYRTGQIAHDKALEAEAQTRARISNAELNRKFTADQFKRSEVNDRAIALAERSKNRLDLQRRIAQARILSSMDPEGAAKLLDDIGSEIEAQPTGDATEQTAPSPSGMPDVGVKTFPTLAGKVVKDSKGVSWLYKGKANDPTTDKDPKNWVRQ